MLTTSYRSNMQLVMGGLYLVRLGSDDFGVYGPRTAGPGEFGTSLLVRGSMSELTAFFTKKGLEVPAPRV